jgi:hypothetical protein
MDRASDSEIQKAFKNCPGLEPVELMEVPVKGWVEEDGIVHFYDEETESVWVPKIERENIEGGKLL